MRRAPILIALLFAAVLCHAADFVTFDHVKIHRHKNAQRRVLVDKVGSLMFDDRNQRMSFASGAGDRFEVRYDDVVKVVFEVTTHMHGGTLTDVISAASVPGLIAGAIIKAQHVHDYWFYLEYKDGEQNVPVLLEVPKDSAADVIAKATGLFGARVTIPSYPEKGEDMDPETLPAFKSKQRLRCNRENHPLPEMKPDKALVVVVCPPLSARYAGVGYQFKLHANDHVIAVNTSGTYSFAYLDPGKYKLVSQSVNANGFDMELEAGKPYYFLQNTFEGAVKDHTALSRNSAQLVMYLLSGSYYADWSPK